MNLSAILIGAFRRMNDARFLPGWHFGEAQPYRFGDFDILAVNMHPSSGDWQNFRYTVASWLLPRGQDKSLIEIFQPVASDPNDVWTDDLSVCLDWFISGENRSVLTEILHLPKSKTRAI